MVLPGEYTPKRPWTLDTKDGGMAWISLECNLQTQHVLDQKHKANMPKLRILNWSKDTHGWNFERYRAAHKTCFTIQFKLHHKHGYQDIPQRDKVNLFIEGIKDHRFDAVIIFIKDSQTPRENFEAAQNRVCEFKSILDGCMTFCERHVMATDSRGGGRSGSNGRSGAGFGRGRVRERGGYGGCGRDRGRN